MKIPIKNQLLPRGAPPRIFLPHVTDVFYPWESGPPTDRMADRILFGKQVHEVLESHDNGSLLLCEPEFEPMLQSYRAFLSDHQAQVVAVEFPVGGREFGYVGTLDRVLRIGERGALSIWDIKTGGPWWTHGMQTAAYEHAYRVRHLPGRTKPLLRGTVHLRLDGYSTEIHRSPHDINDFLAFLRVYSRLVTEGLVKERVRT